MDLVFYNKVMDRIAMKQVVNGLVTRFGITYTTHVLDQLKALGSRQATYAGVSLGIDDLLTAPSKSWLIKDAELWGNLSEKHHNYGDLHAVEKLRQLVETWYATSEYLKQGMNANFRVTDPANPVHMMSFSGARGSTAQIHQLVGMRGLMSDPQGQIIDLPIQSNFREGLSLTEYIISCYGARKGVVDTAVRTSDAGYLTRRLVEVVQRIVVRKTDCGSESGISASYWEKEEIPHQKLIGRVLAEHVYINNRCFAIRNQDIGNLMASEFITSATESIRVRSPLTCKNMLWICQLCYGWNLTNGFLVEIGEAVGIIAGQSIGEPGTQLTLRTFHTGGVFAGDIAKHVRTPSNGIIEFDEDSVYPTRTRHGHPAWICHNSLFLSIRSKSEIHELMIPPKSLLLVRNNQYVESKQVIAEIRAKASPPKEKIHKYIYSDLDGEMYWMIGVRHASAYIHSCIHPTLKTSHVWVLSGKSCGRNDKLPIPFYDNQDRIDSNIFIAKEESLPTSPRNQDQSNVCIFNSYVSEGGIIFARWGLTHAVYNGLNQSVGCNTIPYGYDIVRKGKNPFLREMYTKFHLSLEIKSNGSLRNNDSFAIADYPKYELRNEGIIRYGTIRTGLSRRGNDSRDEGAKTARSEFEIVKEGNVSFIPEEVLVSIQALSSISIRNNEFVAVGTPITSTVTSKMNGLVRVKKKINNTYEVKILPGVIYYPHEAYELSKQIGILIPPGKIIFHEVRCNHWTYLQWIIPFGEKPFALLRSMTEYNTSNESNKTTVLNLLRDTDLEINAVNYLLYADGERVEKVGGEYIQSIRTRWIVRWGRRYFFGKAHISFLRIRTRNYSKNYLQINLIHCFSPKGRKNTLYSKYVLRKNYYTDLFSIYRNQLISKHRGIIRISSNGRNGYNSSIVLSPLDLIEVTRVMESKAFLTKSMANPSSEFFDFWNQQKKKDPLLRRNDSLWVEERIKLVEVRAFDRMSLMGNSRNARNPSDCLYRVSHTETASDISPPINQSRDIFLNSGWYFVDESNGLHLYRFERHISRESYESHPSSSRIKSQILSLGQFFFENSRIPEYERVLPSGQVIGIHADYSVMRLGKPQLANEGAIIRNNFGGSIKEGETLMTLAYERLKSGDIIQGLPKVEQLLEARSVNSLSIDLENSFKDWNNDMKGFIGNLRGFLLGARISTQRGQMILVDRIQKVYKSQGVQISNKHIEIVVRQMTSRVLTSEDGIIDIFSPGELIEFSQARRMNRVLEEAIPYEPVLLGITKASLNTQSFVSEASFQETTRVLARAALRGRIDWLKGLKESVVVGGVIPAGTGSKEIIWQRILEGKEEIFLSDMKSSFEEELGNTSPCRNTSIAFPAIETVRNTLKESVSGKDILPII